MARILITGATAGIGREATLHLARHGHEVFAAARRGDALRALEKEFAEEAGAGGAGATAGRGRIRGIALDVTDADSIDAARRWIEQETDGHGLDVLVNNAGYGQGGPLELVSDAELRAQYDTNVFGLMAVTRAFLPKMRERGRGRIVNVGSVAGTIALPFLGAYASTKHAVQGLSESLRRELRPHGVEVVVIRPGAIRTGFGQGEAEGLGASAEPGSPYAERVRTFMKWHAQLHPKAPEPRVVAEAILHAATAPRPRPYYVVPASNLGVVWLQKLLPARWVDAVIERVSGIAGVR